MTLFAFGRTLWCACGSRVGLQPRVRVEAPAAPKRFLADAMLGKLARWLRLLGFDCAHEAHIADADLVRRGLSEQRIILTRDRSLPEEWWVEGIHVVVAAQVRDQLVEVLRELRLADEIQLFSRCAECNLPLRHVARALVRERVPASVFATREGFESCEGCGRVYWQGSHTDRFRRFVARLLATV